MADEIQFPQYPQNGIPIGHPKQGAPLMKMIKQVMKPKLNQKSFRKVFDKHKKPKWL